ncbi:MAG: molecular chaperone HtpG [Collinsella sp.]|nr:molecular chaperone HtpG [Collinsella sp.]
MRQFKTESKKLLDLMINSIYTNKEIFLRELISNASDAVDKLNFKSLTDSSIQVNQDDLAIRVSFDADARTLTVSDNGIGMTAAALEENLGTIAHSGSQEFKQENAEAQGGDVDIIGQFGVGFYSAFMVASKVRVVTRAFGEDAAHVWESDGLEGYTIEEGERAEHGTDVILTIRENQAGADGEPGESYDTYLSEWGLKDLVRRYSNYVRYPIQMMVTKSRQKPKPADAGEDYTPEYEDYQELETLNSMTPIWKKRAADVTPEEYAEFYKATFHDWEDPARTISFHAEGGLEYDALLFIPGKAPFDLYSKDYQKGLALYSSNVMIQEKCAELVPDYFNFVRGIVDSADISLNISRETLQHDRQLRAIAGRVEKKIAADLADMRDNDRAAFETFFENFGRGLKYGIYASYGMKKDDLADFLLFYSAKQEKLVTLKEYREAAPEDQKAIYYAAGDSTERLAHMPMVTSVLARGYDVLLCTQDVDDFCFQAMQTYDEQELKNVAGGNLDLETEEDKKAAEEVASENGSLLGAMKDALGDKVVKVTVSPVLTDAPSALSSEGPISLEMEKVMAGQAGAEDVRSQRVLELNAKHPIFATLRAAEEAGDTEKIASYTDLLYNQALLVAGLPIEDPVAFAQAVCELMK